MDPDRELLDVANYCTTGVRHLHINSIASIRAFWQLMDKCISADTFSTVLGENIEPPTEE